jgi:hypothetical protein
VIVQKEPAAPVYPKQSFVTWRSPFRAEDADTEAAPSESLRVTKPATRTSAKTVVITMNFIVVCLSGSTATIMAGIFTLHAGLAWLDQSLACHFPLGSINYNCGPSSAPTNAPQSNSNHKAEGAARVGSAEESAEEFPKRARVSQLACVNWQNSADKVPRVRKYSWHKRCDRLSILP